jgi:hypothetical protein
MTHFVLNNAFLIIFFSTVYFALAKFINKFFKAEELLFYICSTLIYLILTFIILFFSYSYSMSMKKFITDFQGKHFLSQVIKEKNYEKIIKSSEMSAIAKQAAEQNFDEDILRMLTELSISGKFKFEATYFVIQPCPSYAFRMHNPANLTEAKIKENEIILNQKSDYNAKLWRKIKNKYHFYLAGLSNFKFYNFYTNQSCDNINVFNLNTQENANIKGIVLNEIPQNLNLGVRWIIKDLEAKKYYVFTQISTQYEHEGIKADKTEFSFEEVASLLEIKDAEFVELLSKNNISL